MRPGMAFDDPVRIGLMSILQGWVTVNPSVIHVYTLKRMANGQWPLMLDLGHGGGSIVGETHQEVSDQTAIQEALFGNVAIADEPTHAPYGSYISAFAPLRNRTGDVTAILGVDFDAQIFLNQQMAERWKVFSQFMVLLLSLLGGAAFMVSLVEVRRQKQLAATAEQLGIEKQRTEDVINSINGLVWEREAGMEALSWVSQRADGFLGVSREEWLSQPGRLASLVHPEDRNWVGAKWDDIVKHPASYHMEYRAVSADGKLHWISENGTATRTSSGRVLLRGVLMDVTERREAAEQLADANQQLVEASHRSGMAEVATGVLHNVGNLLNSVNVTASLMAQRLDKCRVGQLREAVALLHAEIPNAATFFSSDPRGQALPRYLDNLGEQMQRVHDSSLTDLRQILKSLQHIRDVIVLQQCHSRTGPIRERVDIVTLVEDALKLEESAFHREGVELEKHFADVPPVLVSRSQVLQILVNLIRNSRQALARKTEGTRRVTLSVLPAEDDKVRVMVDDNGCGISAENLERVFQFGFTTKVDGHGFGLHHSVLLAQGMGGTLSASSAGEGEGATFTLELPLAVPAAPDISESLTDFSSPTSDSESTTSIGA